MHMSAEILSLRACTIASAVLQHFRPVDNAMRVQAALMNKQIRISLSPRDFLHAHVSSEHIQQHAMAVQPVEHLEPHHALCE